MTLTELYDFMFAMMKEVNHERLWEYYIHKSTFSEMTFEEFLSEQEFATSQVYTAPAVTEKTKKYAESIIQIVSSEEVRE